MRNLILTLILLLTPLKSEAVNIKKAYFAAGCFWCIQPVYDSLDGVIETSVGYAGITGNETVEANYKNITTGTSGYLEAIEVTYNPSEVSYSTLLENLWLNIDPYDKYGQFADKGEQYQSAIIYNTEQEKVEALESAKKLEIADYETRILEFKSFFDAEEYHQDYYKKNPMRYNMYKYGSGRLQRLKQLWNK